MIGSPAASCDRFLGGLVQSVSLRPRVVGAVAVAERADAPSRKTQDAAAASGGMDQRLTGAVFRLTVVLVTAGFCLVGAGTAGLTGSLVLVAVLLGLGGVVYALAQAVDDADLDRYDTADIVPVVPAGPVVGRCDCGLPVFRTASGRRCLDGACERFEDEGGGRAGTEG